MKVCGQTLILVDTDGSVNDVNQKIVKATLEYMFMNSPDNRAYCLETYGHRPDYEEVYTMDMNELYRQCESISFSEKDSNLTDVICEVISGWRESDFSCRDILVFTDGLEGEALNYDREELFYLLNNTDYPVYVVELVQDNNAHVRKDLSALATTSGGKLFFTEFEGDDASVEVQIAEKIFSRMREYEAANWAVYETDYYTEESFEDNTGQNGDFNAGLSENNEYVQKDMPEYYGEYTDESVEVNALENTKDDNMEDDSVIITSKDSDVQMEGTLVVGALIVCFALVILGLLIGIMSAKKHRKNAGDDRKIRDEIEKNIRQKSYFESDEGNDEKISKYKTCNTLDAKDSNITRILESEEKDDNETRILSQESGYGIKLIDMNSNNKVIFITTDYPHVIGRKREYCDIVFEDDSLSKRHCELGLCEGGYYCKDLESSNGTYINGIRIVSEYIVTGDILKIGMKEYVVQCL